MSEEGKNPSSGDLELEAKGSPEEGQDHRLERYAKAKKRSTVIADYIIKNHPELKGVGHGVRECGQFLIYRHFFNIGLYRMIGGCTCRRHLLCMLCAIRRAAKQLQAYLEKVEHLKSGDPSLKLGLITLTVKNGDDLAERYEHLKRGLQRLTNRRKFQLNNIRTIKTVMSMVKGAVWTYEATKKDKGWHPHIHMLAIFEDGVDLGDMQEEIPGSWRKTRTGAFEKGLCSEWQQITGDSFIVDVRPITAGKDMLGAFCEVFKYALKVNGMAVADQIEAYKKLKGRRLISSVGSLYGVKVPPEDRDTIEGELELEPYVDLLYKYSEIHGYQLDNQIKPKDILSKIIGRKFILGQRASMERQAREVFDLISAPGQFEEYNNPGGRDNG